MNKKTLIALAVIALGLLAYIGLVERHSLSTGEVSGREARLLPRLVRGRVEQVLLEHGDQRIKLVRVRAEEGELGEWRLEEPIEGRADQEAVASLLGSLDWADARRKLGPAEDSDLGEWGLTSPRAQVTLRVADETVALALGGPASTGDGVYARVGERDVAIVGQDLLEALTAEASHFRDKRLFANVNLAAIEAVGVTRPQVEPALELSFERDGERYWLAGDTHLLASAGRVREISRGIAELTAQRFADDVTPADAGLEDAQMTLTLRSGDPVVERRVAVGAPCEGHSGERYVRADEGPVVCVAESELGVFERPAEAYRQARIVTLTFDALAGVEVRVAGQSLSLTHDDDGYHYDAGSAGEGAADEAAVGEWLAAVSRIAPVELLPISEAEFSSYGLAGEPDTVTLSARDDAPAEVLSLGAVTPDGQWLRRGEEDAVLRISSDDAARLALNALELRSRSLVREREASVASVTLTRAGTEERLARQDGRWQVVAPVQVPADGARVSNVARKLARLDALRFVSAHPQPEQGLAAPRLEISARYEGALADDEDGEATASDSSDTAPREHTLRLGATVADGVYAQLDDDPTVFILPAEWSAELTQAFASRDLLRSTATQVRALELTTPSGAVSLHYDGMAWATEDGAADPDRTDALLEAVHSLRATSVEAYLPSVVPMATPELRLEVTRVDDANEPRHYVVDIAPADTLPTRRARREDLAIDFRVPAGAVETLLTYRP